MGVNYNFKLFKLTNFYSEIVCKSLTSPINAILLKFQQTVERQRCESILKRALDEHLHSSSISTSNDVQTDEHTFSFHKNQHIDDEQLINQNENKTKKKEGLK